MTFNLITLEETSYLNGLMLQENLFNAQLEKKAKAEPTTNYLILLQHQPVYTLGKSGDIENLKVPIEKTDAEFFRTNRGGDITFHGPGQLVGYPIFDLDSIELGTKEYVEKLEDCVIECIKGYGLLGTRIDGASGVWVDSDSAYPRKICALGIKVSRGITMHGFALNINTDLGYFDNIVPCGLDDKAVTSMSKELNKPIDFWKVQQRLQEIIENKFN